MEEEDKKKQNDELGLFGFLTAQMRVGLVTFFYAVLIVTVIFLYRDNKACQFQNTKMQQEWKDEVVREVRAQIIPLQQQVHVATKEVITTSKNVDSLLIKKGGESK